MKPCRITSEIKKYGRFGEKNINISLENKIDDFIILKLWLRFLRQNDNQTAY